MKVLLLLRSLQLIISTKELRQSKLTSIYKKIKVNVCGQNITESNSEKLLGIMIDNDLTFKTYLYGNDKTGSDKETGILTKLSQRIGIFKKLSSVVTRSQLKSISDGIFNSLNWKSSLIMVEKFQIYET